MSAGHTPGPWAAEVEDEPEEDRAAEIYVCHPGTSCDATVVCTMGGSHTGLMDERLANARLIAAAPDLLAVARLMIPQGVCLTNRNVRDDVIVALDVSMGDLRAIAAAIAKATGQ